MPPAFPLYTEALDADLDDVDATRRALLEVVATQVRHGGQPVPRLTFVGADRCAVLELDPVARQDRDAHVGATIRGVLAAHGFERAFLTMRLIATDAAGKEHEAALVVEERVEDGVRRWWSATLPYETIAETGLGRPSDWQVDGETDPSTWEDFLRVMLLPGPLARAARTLPPRPRAPDIRAAFGDLPEHVPLPTNALEQTDLTAALVVNEICRDGLDGVVVLRLRGHAWEQWVLGDGMPAGLDDMIRYLCQREPEADAVALVQIALFEEAPAIQIVAERAGTRAERRLVLEFPAGPSGPKHVGRVMARSLPMPPDGEGWLGVDPMVDFELGPMGVAEG